MKKRLLASLLVVIYFLTFLTGCWDRKELNELGIVVALGFDKESQTGKIQLTSQIIRPGSLQKQSGGSKEPPYEIVVTTGKTVLEAIRNTVKEFDRRSFFSHVSVIVVSEAIAREGLNDIIDFISRTHEIRKMAWIVTAQGDEARKVLGIKHGITSVQASYMEGIIKRQISESESASSQVIDFIKEMPGEGMNPITGVFSVASVEKVSTENNKVEKSEGLKLSGIAVYKKDKLAGFLNNEESRGLNFALAKIKSCTMRVPSLQDKSKGTSIEVKKVNSSIKPSIIEGKVSFSIEVKVTGNITEVDDTTDVSKPHEIEKINNEFKEFISNNINMAVSKIQKELKTDVIGFGSAFERKFPKEWRELKDKWDLLFPDIAYSIKVDSKINLTGMLLKPIPTKETSD